MSQSQPQRQKKQNDRRRQLRAQAARRGPAVQRAPAWEGDWDALAPEQRFLNSCGFALALATIAAHALGGLVYGQLSLFVVVGLADLQGGVAAACAGAELALAAAWGTHLLLRHRHGMGAAGRRVARHLPQWRRRAYAAAALLACATVLLWLVAALRLWRSLAAWPGLAPHSEWLLAPLPWAWHWLLPAARDALQVWWIVGAVVAMCIGAWCFSGSRTSPRAGLACIGAALASIGFWALGGAAYHYAAVRSLAPGVHDAALALARQSRPGHYNADTFLWWLSGASLMLLGALFIAGAARIPSAALARSFQQHRG